MKCSKCNLFELQLIETPTLPHYGKHVCFKCGFIRWVSNPSKPKYRKAKRNRHDNWERCVFCCRTKEILGQNEVIEEDHKLPLEMGGKDEFSNVMPLCSACHKLKNWMVTYITKHLNRKSNEVVQS